MYIIISINRVTGIVTKSPSGALSPYYYKGGYFHGIHYGSYFDNAAALLAMMQNEESFILKSPQKRRILIDLYETTLTTALLRALAEHIARISPRVIKLAVSASPKGLRQLQKAFLTQTPLGSGQLHFCPDMEEAKTWLVSETVL